jgi:hypothetical protein
MRHWPLLTALLAAVSPPATAQDFEREVRWRAAVAPNLAGGDAVELRSADGRA